MMNRQHQVLFCLNLFLLTNKFRTGNLGREDFAVNKLQENNDTVLDNWTDLDSVNSYIKYLYIVFIV